MQTILKTLFTSYHGMFRLYRWLVLGLIIFFIFGIILGVVLPASLKMIMLDLVMQKFAAITGDASTAWQLTERIFLNNFLVSGLLYLLGFIVIFPIFLMVINGLVIGIFFDLVYRYNFLYPGTFWSSLIGLIPHGIFELTAFFLAGTLSIAVILKVLFNKIIEPQKSRKQVLLESAIRFFTLIIPLLIVAALVECYVSPLVSTVIFNKINQSRLDASLAINLNETVLNKYHCTSTPNTQTKALDNSDADFSKKLLTTLYNNEVITQFKQRKSIPVWEQYYYCDQNMIIGIRAYPAQQWSVTQAIQLQEAFLTAAGESFQHPNNNPNIFITNSPAFGGTITFQNYQDRTVGVVITNGEITADEVLQK
ncbi:MAG: stage II sporulation protein M [Patescibacteria group bacterium]|jgi:stage II sporulation protein M